MQTKVEQLQCSPSRACRVHLYERRRRVVHRRLPFCSTSPSTSADAHKQVINKVPTGTNFSPELYEYILNHTREPNVLKQLRAETPLFSKVGARMQITPEQGSFMALLTEICGVSRALEIGVFTGYSSLAVALALPQDGLLVALDRDESAMAVARKYWEAAGVRHKVEDHVGPALESLQRVRLKYGPGAFDFCFIDADKANYDAYYEAALELVRPGGLIAVDNVLWYGKVADPQVQDKKTNLLRALNDKLMADPRISFSLLPIGDGMGLCRRR